MPVILIAFIVMLSLAAFLPGARDDLAAERLLDGQVAAGQLRTWHAAAVRACWVDGGLCTPGASTTGVIAEPSVKAQLPQVSTTAAGFSAGRFGSYYDGTYVFSVYTGMPARTAAMAKESFADAAAALVQIASADSFGSIGYWNGTTGQFIGNSYTVILNHQPRVRAPMVVATQPASFVAGAVSGVPMIATRVR